MKSQGKQVSSNYEDMSIDNMCYMWGNQFGQLTVWNALDGNARRPSTSSTRQYARKTLYEAHKVAVGIRTLRGTSNAGSLSGEGFRQPWTSPCAFSTMFLWVYRGSCNDASASGIVSPFNVFMLFADVLVSGNRCRCGMYNRKPRTSTIARRMLKAIVPRLEVRHRIRSILVGNGEFQPPMKIAL